MSMLHKLSRMVFGGDCTLTHSVFAKVLMTVQDEKCPLLPFAWKTMLEFDDVRHGVVTAGR